MLLLPEGRGDKLLADPTGEDGGQLRCEASGAEPRPHGGCRLQRTPMGAGFPVAVRALEAEQRDGAPPLVYHDQGYHQLDSSSALEERRRRSS